VIRIGSERAVIFGFLIIVVGMLFERRRLWKSKTSEIANYPILDFNNARQRRTSSCLRESCNETAR
jgi:hypothetical protein